MKKSLSPRILKDGDHNLADNFSRALLWSIALHIVLLCSFTLAFPLATTVPTAPLMELNLVSDTALAASKNSPPTSTPLNATKPLITPKVPSIPEKQRIITEDVLTSAPPAETQPILNETSPENISTTNQSNTPISSPNSSNENSSPTISNNGLLQPPRILKRVEPSYPEQARRNGYEGTVILKATIFANGTISNLDILSSSGYIELDEAALQALKKWRFIPARYSESGSSTDSIVSIPIIFNLN